MSHIKVSYEVYSTAWTIREALNKLVDIDLMAFDIETRGLYLKKHREEAAKLLEADTDIETHKLASVVANNSGLSFPAVIRTTHFVFGMSNSHSIIMVTPTRNDEMMVWNWLRVYYGKLLIHNTLFDLKVMYHRVGAVPRNYEDTQLLLKTLINNSDVWRAKVALKDAMGEYYDPKWALFDDYDQPDLKNRAFLDYAAIDGAATFKLWDDMQIHILGDAWTHESERDFK